MPYNRIISKKALSEVVKNGNRIIISAATETTLWTRPEFAVQKIAAPLTKAVAKLEDSAIPKDTKEMCAR